MGEAARQAHANQLRDVLGGSEQHDDPAGVAQLIGRAALARGLGASLETSCPEAGQLT
jgi:hypothetical protein